MLLDGVDLRAIKDKVPFAKDTYGAGLKKNYEGMSLYFVLVKI